MVNRGTGGAERQPSRELRRTRCIDLPAVFIGSVRLLRRPHPPTTPQLVLVWLRHQVDSELRLAWACVDVLLPVI